jgi:hypothetical protein
MRAHVRHWAARGVRVRVRACARAGPQTRRHTARAQHLVFQRPRRLHAPVGVGVRGGDAVGVPHAQMPQALPWTARAGGGVSVRRHCVRRHCGPHHHGGRRTPPAARRVQRSRIVWRTRIARRTGARPCLHRRLLTLHVNAVGRRPGRHCARRPLGVE